MARLIQGERWDSQLPRRVSVARPASPGKCCGSFQVAGAACGDKRRAGAPGGDRAPARRLPVTGRGWRVRLWQRRDYACEVGGPAGCEDGGPVGCEVGGPVGCEVGCDVGWPVGCEACEDDAPGCGTAAQ